jgi:hypothetical protein
MATLISASFRVASRISAADRDGQTGSLRQHTWRPACSAAKARNAVVIRDGFRPSSAMSVNWMSGAVPARRLCSCSDTGPGTATSTGSARARAPWIQPSAVVR